MSITVSPDRVHPSGAASRSGHQPLPLRSTLSERALDALERETVELFEDLLAERPPGSWRPSPVMEKHRLVCEALVRTPGVLRRFRRSFLAQGRVNFPDCPLPRSYFLYWDRRLPYRFQYLAGAARLASMWFILRRQGRIEWSALDDPGVGQPSVYSIPRSGADWVTWLISRLPRGRRRMPPPACYHITEAQIRVSYYRAQIQRKFGHAFGPILEVGGGYGGLAANLLGHVVTPSYLFVELPDSLALAYFYLRACFDCQVQVLFRRGDEIDPAARIILVAPWKLSDVHASVDLLINTMSFQHMDEENLRFYFAQAERLRVTRMYLVNRKTTRDPSDVSIDHYPIPPRLRLVKDRPHPFTARALKHRERWYEAACP